MVWAVTRATIAYPVVKPDSVAQVEGSGRAVEVGVKGKVKEALPWSKTLKQNRRDKQRGQGEGGRGS